MDLSKKRVTVILEVGMNHDGSFGQAKALVEAAANTGVDAVKFQTHIAAAETIISGVIPSLVNGISS
jgi:N-acetylneuraminate synthase